MYYLSDICSFCLVSNQNMKSILSKDSDNIVIEEKLKTLLLKPIHFKPHIPRYICDNCLKNLNFCHKFKLRCIENIATLNTYVEKLEVHGSYTNLSITLLTHRKYNKEEALELENQNYSNTCCKNQIQTNCPQDNNVAHNEFIKEEIEETEIVYDENIIMAENRQINSADIKAEIKEDIQISFEDTVLEEKLTNVLNKLQGPYDDFMQFNEEKIIIEESENLTNNNMEELLNKTTEHIVKPHVSANFEDEDYVSDPELFEDNSSDDEYLPSHTSSSAPSEAADSDLDTVETSASHKVIKSKGTNSNETAICPASEKITKIGRGNKNNEKCNKKLYNCKDCNKSFSYLHHLTSHSRVHIQDKSYKYSSCHETFEHSEQLMSHKRSHNEEVHACDVCLKAFNCKSNLTIHKGIHNNLRPYKCSVCNKEFAHRFNLTIHERIHTSETPYKCNVCNKAFSRRFHLTTHKQIHSGKKTYKCNVCNKVCAQRSHLTKHERIHTGEKPYTCNLCNKTFSDRSQLTIHERIHSGEKPYKCNVCSMAFVRSSDLTKHERMHTGKKPYICNVCNKAFAQSSNLIRHERIHTGEKPYKCNVCNWAFTGSSDLISHERTHTGEKPYKCNVCNKAFAHRNNFTIHERIHSGKKPYKCNFCNKAFAHSSYLTKHERIHTGEKPYKCNVCNKAFNHRSILKTHERIHNNDRRYKCSVCNEEFTQKFNLTTHMRMHKIQSKA